MTVPPAPRGAGVVSARLAARRCRAFVGALVLRPSGGGVIGVISPQRGEGRSTVAAGLALSLAHEGGGRVLLLDLDIERPTQAATFGISPGPGVRDCLGAARDLETVTAAIAPRLWLAPPGGGGALASPGLLRDVAESGLLDDCRATFTWTVVDLPPILDAPGVAPVAARADECLLVGRYRRTRVAAMARAAGMLPAPPLGCVMTAHACPVPGWFSRLLGTGSERLRGRC